MRKLEEEKERQFRERREAEKRQYQEVEENRSRKKQLRESLDALLDIKAKIKVIHHEELVEREVGSHRQWIVKFPFLRSKTSISNEKILASLSCYVFVC